MSAPPTLVALPPSFINYTDHITSSAFLLGVVALVALHFLLRATDASHFARHWLWPCFLHLFRDPAGDTANSSVPASLELGLGKTVEQQQREQETNGAVARWLARINGAIVEEETTPRWIQQPDPMRLSAVLSVVILAHALGAFGTLLVFPVDGITACAFLTGWTVLLGQFVRVVAFLHLTLSLRDTGRTHPYEIFLLYTLLAVRQVVSFVYTALNIGEGALLPTPHFSPSIICVQRTAPVIGVVVASFDFFVATSLAIRFVMLDLMPDFAHDDARAHQDYNSRLGWKRLARSVFQRRYAKLLSVMILVASNVAGSVGRTNIAGSRLPPAFALIALLFAFNKPPLPPLPSPTLLARTAPTSHATRSVLSSRAPASTINRSPSSTSRTHTDTRLAEDQRTRQPLPPVPESRNVMFAERQDHGPSHQVFDDSAPAPTRADDSIGRKRRSSPPPISAQYPQPQPKPQNNDRAEAGFTWFSSSGAPTTPRASRSTTAAAPARQNGKLSPGAAELSNSRLDEHRDTPADHKGRSHSIKIGGAARKVKALVGSKNATNTTSTSRNSPTAPTLPRISYPVMVENLLEVSLTADERFGGGAQSETGGSDDTDDRRETIIIKLETLDLKVEESEEKEVLEPWAGAFESQRSSQASEGSLKGFVKAL